MCKSLRSRLYSGRRSNCISVGGSVWPSNGSMKRTSNFRPAVTHQSVVLQGYTMLDAIMHTLTVAHLSTESLRAWREELPVLVFQSCSKAVRLVRRRHIGAHRHREDSQEGTGSHLRLQQEVSAIQPGLIEVTGTLTGNGTTPFSTRTSDQAPPASFSIVTFSVLAYGDIFPGTSTDTLIYSRRQWRDPH